MFPSAVQVATQVLRSLLLAVETVRAVAEPALDVSREPLARELIIAGLSHLDWAPVREARGLAAGQEPVEVGAGAGRPGDLARAQGRGHDEAARAAAVTGFLPVMSHAEAGNKNVLKCFNQNFRSPSLGQIIREKPFYSCLRICQVVETL